MFRSLHATDDGHRYAAAVLAGSTTPEEAGDAWVKWADESHECGVAFLAAYDADGAPR